MIKKTAEKLKEKTENSQGPSLRKLSIAMVCDPIGSNKSGVVVSTLRFAKLLKERGHHVIFIAAKSKEHRDHSQHGDIKAYRYRSLPVPRSNGWNLAFPTVKELKKVFQEEKINVVHILLPMSGAIIAIRAAKALNIKIVAHSHSQPENLFMDMPKIIQPTLGKLWNKYLAWVYSKAELIIYPTEFGRRLLCHLTEKDKSSAIVSNGVNLDRYKPTEIGDFHNRFNIPKDTVKIVYVGRLFPEKSLHTLIKAIPYIIQEHPNVHIMLAGTGHVRPKLEKLIRNLNIHKHVTFLGLVSDEDKILAYNAGDIFVSPSFAELEGMTVLEAMACGKPIIVPDAEMNAAKFFVDGNGFLFETENHEDLAHQVLKLITDASLRKKMGENSLKKVKNYDINKSADRLEKVYYEVLKK
ncbi:MAG: glycosyltransferase [bacterium]